MDVSYLSHTKPLFFSILAINDKGVKIKGRFSFPTGGREGEREE